ncbi:MAG: YfhO family protein, partial [Bacteroidota bacterium]|nr:YfhO family protein [Bacteroidota bacterium]
LIVAIIVMLSGFTVGNAQHMGWIVSATWIPFVFNSYLNISKKKNYIPVFSTVFFASLLLTGGYFPFFLTTIYSIFVIFAVKIINFYKQKEKSILKNFLLKNTTLAIIVTLVNIVVILSVFEASQFIPRGENITLEKALGQSIEIKGLLTFIFPYANTFGDANFWGDEKTVMNSYFGFFSFLILLFGIFIKKDKRQRTFLILGIFAFMTAMAHVFPFRRIFYYSLPFFNYFRFPSLFRYFGILAFAIFVGITLSKILKNKLDLKKIKYLFIVVLGVLSFIFILFSVKYGLKTTISTWLENQDKLNFGQTILIQSIFHTILIISLLLVLFLTKSIKKLSTFIMLIIIFDMIFSVQLNSKETIISIFNPKEIHNKVNKLPKGFPIPDLNKKIIDNNDKNGNLHPLWRNVNYYHKNIAFDGYGPYQLNNFTELENSVFFNDILNNKLFYFAKNIQDVHNIDTAFVHNNPQGIIITNNDEILKQKFNKADSNFIKILQFKPKKITVETYNNKKSVLVFMQNKFPAWKAFVDGKETEIFEVNYSLQAIILEKGKHNVEFRFVNKKIQFAAYFSAIMYLLLIVLIIFTYFKSK